MQPPVYAEVCRYIQWYQQLSYVGYHPNRSDTENETQCLAGSSGWYQHIFACHEHAGANENLSFP
jgi:hypothetical protein